MDVKIIFVVGAGQMGAGIAEVAARSGFQTLLIDVDESIVTRAKQKMQERLQAAQQKGKLRSEEVEGTLGRIRGAKGLTEAKAADVVIEAVIEKEDLKIR